MSLQKPWHKAFPQANDWDTPVDMSTLDDLLTRSIVACPEAPCLTFRERTLSYAALGAAVDRVAAGLLVHGVGRGDAVALFLPNTPFHPIVFFAIARTGAKIVCLSPLDALRELKHKLEVAKATRLITINLPSFLPRAIELLDAGVVETVWVGDDADWGAGLQVPVDMPSRAGVASLNDLMQTPVPDRWPLLRMDDVVLLQFTGGTTGKPKAAMLSHANLTAAACMASRWRDVEQVAPGEGRSIGVLPMFHIYAIVVVLIRNIGDGQEILLHERFDVEAVARDITVKRATALAAVPTMWIALLNRPGAENEDYSSLKACISGGAPLPFEVKTRIEKLIGNWLGNGWGMTETAGCGSRVPRAAPLGAGIIGVPLTDEDIKIVSLDTKAPVAVGEIGELAITGPNIFKGYYGDEAATEVAFHDGYFLTGDMGYMDDHGLIHLVDRLKNMIICGGFNVYPATIENAIYEHEAVEEVIVIGIADAYRGQAAKAFIKLKAQAQAFALPDLQDFLKDRLGRHEIPRALEFREALPKSAAGKLLARVLVEEEQAQSAAPENISEIIPVSQT
jgi:long-chain acyl-CoA synthetase